MEYLIIIITLWLCVNITPIDNLRNSNLYKKANHYYVNLALIFILACMTFIVAFRATNVGLDTITYKLIYDSGVDNIDMGFEPLCSLIFYICSKIGLDFLIVKLIFSLSTFIFVYLALKELSVNPFFSLLLFITFGIYAQTFNIMRQALSLSICMFSIKYIKSKNLMGYIVCVFFAIMCHASALIFIPTYFLTNIRLNWKWNVACLIFILICSILFPEILKILSNVTTIDYYTRYYVDKTYYSDVSLMNVIFVLFNIGLFFMLFILKRKIEKLPNNTDVIKEDLKMINLFLNMFFISALIRLFSLFTPTVEVVGRLNIMYFFSFIFIVPYIFKYLFKDNNILLNLFIIICLVYYYLLIYIKKSCGIIPYNYCFGESIVLKIACLICILALCILSIIVISRCIFLKKESKYDT